VIIWPRISPADSLRAVLHGGAFVARDRRELDVWLQYRPTEGPFKGFRLKTQYANVWQEGNVRDSQPEFRFIIDYTVLFRPPLAQ
jgi:hypothetical protein